MALVMQMGTAVLLLKIGLDVRQENKAITQELR